MSEKKNHKNLIQDLVSGDSHAFDELYRQYYPKVYSFSYKYLQNKQEAEEVVQEVFIILWNGREKLKDVRNLNAWLFTITFNQIRKVFRSMAMEKKKMEIVAANSVFENNSVLSELEFNDLMLKAGDLIEKLPSRQKAVLLLSIKDGLNSSEISSELKIKKRTVENHLSNARAFLKKVMKEENLIPLVILWFLL